MDHDPKFVCPVDNCNIDMTQAVCEQCEQTTVTPLFTLEAKAAVRGTPSSSAAKQTRVALQCPKGHWAEYMCPKSTT